MKIVFLQDDFPPFAKGGAGIVAATLARELTKRGHELTVVTTVQDESQAGSFQEDSLRIERIYSDYAQRWRSWRSLYNPTTVPVVQRILSDVKPDVVHAHNVHYHLSYWALRLAKRGGAKVFLTAHDVMTFHYGKLVEFVDPKQSECKKEWNYKVSPWQQMRKYRFWYNPFRNVVIRHLLKSVDKIFAVSMALKDALEQNGITNVAVVHNGIAVSAWKKVAEESTAAFINRYDLKGKKVVLFGGRISASKGGDVMLDVLYNLVHEDSETVLLLLGKANAYAGQLMNRAATLGVAEHVISTGWISGDDLHAAFHIANVVVVPSMYLDPFPTVVLEAMAASKPVVGSCFGGIPEMVLENETGYVVNPHVKEHLTERVADLLDDPALQTRFGKAGNARAQTEFSLDVWCVRTLHAYTSAYDY